MNRIILLVMLACLLPINYVAECSEQTQLFACTIAKCTQVFSSKRGLSNHMRSHDELPTEALDKALASRKRKKPDSQTDSDSDSDEKKKIVSYLCSYCSKGYTSRYYAKDGHLKHCAEYKRILARAPDSTPGEQTTPPTLCCVYPFTPAIPTQPSMVAYQYQPIAPMPRYMQPLPPSRTLYATHDSSVTNNNALKKGARDISLGQYRGTRTR